MIETFVHQVMTPTAHIIPEDTTATDAARELRQRHIGSCVVSDVKEEIAGIVTRSDLVELVAQDSPTDTPVSQIMSTPVRTIERTATIHEAAQQMQQYRVKKLPVIENGELLGILTTTDLAHYLPRYRTNILDEESSLSS